MPRRWVSPVSTSVQASVSIWVFSAAPSRPLSAATPKSRRLALNHSEVPMSAEALPDGRIALTRR